MHGFGAFYFGLPRLADQLLYRWHSGYSPFARRLWAHERSPCSSFFCAKRVRITQTPHRSPRSWERRGGFPEDRGTARILTTSILKPKPEKHPMTRRVVRIGGVGTLVNSLKSCGFTPADRSEESRGRAV